MSYIVVASFYPESEKVRPDWREKWKGRILAERDGQIKVDVRGDHMRTEEITKQFCSDLIDAGIYEFELYHSY